MALTDRTPEIWALVRIGRIVEAKTRAQAWADEVPQDYRAHLAAAFSEVNFLNCSFVDVYFDPQRRKRFEIGIERAMMFADDEQKKEIKRQTGAYLNTLKKMDKFHPAAYAQLTSPEGAAASAEIYNRSKSVYDEKTKLEAEIKKLQDGIIYMEKALEREDYKLQNARRDYEFIENKGPAKGSFLTKKKREREYTYSLARVKANCRTSEEGIEKFKTAIENNKAQIAQDSEALTALNEQLRELESAKNLEKLNRRIEENKVASAEPWGREFFDKLKYELGLLSAKRYNLECEKERLAGVDGNSKIADGIRANINKLTQEISSLEQFLCRDEKAGGKTSVKKTDKYKTKRI